MSFAISLLILFKRSSFMLACLYQKHSACRAIAPISMVNPDSVIPAISNKLARAEGVMTGDMAVGRLLDVSMITAEAMSLIRNTRKACFSIKKRPKYR